MSTYPVSESYDVCIALVDSTFGLYLGALADDPVTTVNGTYYWNTDLNIFRVWDDTQWNDVNPTQFDGIVDGGGSVTRHDSIQVRGDTAANWSISNPVLLNREIGVETDTGYIKFGVTDVAWNNLPYQTIPNTRVTGFENVDNTSDINKPVSTLQEAADTSVLNTAKAYTDSIFQRVLIDAQGYDASVNLLPISVDIKAGYTFTITNPGTLEGVRVTYKDLLKALVDDPQDINDWAIYPNKINPELPYVISVFVPGNPTASQVCLYHDLPVSITVPINAINSNAKCRVKPYSNTSFILKKNGISIGTVNFTTASFVGTYTFTQGISFSIGDTLELFNAVTPDALIQDVTISILGVKN